MIQYAGSPNAGSGRTCGCVTPLSSPGRPALRRVSPGFSLTGQLDAYVDVHPWEWLRVRAGKGPDLVLTADACYTRENMDRDVLPRILWNGPTMRESLATLRRLRGLGAPRRVPPAPRCRADR